MTKTPTPLYRHFLKLLQDMGLSLIHQQPLPGSSGRKALIRTAFKAITYHDETKLRGLLTRYPFLRTASIERSSRSDADIISYSAAVLASPLSIENFEGLTLSQVAHRQDKPAFVALIETDAVSLAKEEAVTLEKLIPTSTSSNSLKVKSRL